MVRYFLAIFFYLNEVAAGQAESLRVGITCCSGRGIFNFERAYIHSFIC